MDQNINQPEQIVPLQIPNNDGKKSKIWIISIFVVVVILIAGGMGWYFMKNKSTTPTQNIQTNTEQNQNIPQDNNLTTNQQTNTMQNNDQDQMKVVFDKYISAIKNGKFDAFKATLDPESDEMKGAVEQLQQGFDFLSQGAEPAMFDKILSSEFVKTVDVSQKYNIEGLTLYLSQYPQEMINPINKEKTDTRVNAMFLRKVGEDWKIRSYSTFNINKGDETSFNTALEKFLKSIYF
jgi:hypothetical protein